MIFYKILFIEKNSLVQKGCEILFGPATSSLPIVLQEFMRIHQAKGHQANTEEMF